MNILTLTDKEFRIMEQAHHLFADAKKVGAYKKRAKISVKDMCDQHHSFYELYEHRRKLSAIIFNQNKQYAWKSRLHDDGEMWDGLFIVGVTIPGVGDYSYHYHLRYWDEFDVPVVDRAPAYDGHTPEEIDRLFELGKTHPLLPMSNPTTPSLYVEEIKNNKLYEKQKRDSFLSITHPDIPSLLDTKSLYGVEIPYDWVDDMKDGDDDKRDLWCKLITQRNKTGYPYIIFADSM